MHKWILASLTMAWVVGVEGAPLNGSDYEVVIGRTTWDEAKLDAEARGGHLVTISAPVEWSFVKNLVGNLPSDIPLSKRSFPIGLVRDRATQTHSWIDGSDPDGVEDWALNSPNYELDFGDWVYASGGPDHKWNTPYADGLFFELYVLEKPAAPVTAEWNGHTYRVIWFKEVTGVDYRSEGPGWWTGDAQPSEHSVTLGGHVLTITSAEEEAAIREMWARIPTTTMTILAAMEVDRTTQPLAIRWETGEISTHRGELLEGVDWIALFISGSPMQVMQTDGQAYRDGSSFYILEIDPPVTPKDADGDGLTDDQEKNTRHSYSFVQSPTPADPITKTGGFTKAECEADAIARGGHLWDLNSHEEHVAVVTLLEPWEVRVASNYLIVTPLLGASAGTCIRFTGGTPPFLSGDCADLYSTYILEIEDSTDPNNPDTDADGLTDGQEVLTLLTDPVNADSDGDQLLDGLEVNTTKTDPLKADTDGDGLDDYVEVATHRTNPLVVDSDGDGFDDGLEISKATNPLDPSSQPVATLTVYPAIEIEWPTTAGERYQIQVSENLTLWTNLGETFVGTGQPAARFIQARERASFVRVILVK